MFIGTEQLTHVYMPHTPFASEALKDITFSLAAGDFALLIGPSGSGKSTLIQHLNGLLKPSSGAVYFDEKPLSYGKKELLTIRKEVGLVFQNAEEQFFCETVFEEVAFAPRNLGLSEPQVALRVNEALQAVGLDPERYGPQHPFQLSAGQKRLAAIAAVLSLSPRALILDEPTAGLDMAGRKHLFGLLQRLNKEDGLTVLVSTHHLDEAAAVAGSVLVLKAGQLFLAGEADQVFSDRETLEAIGLSLPPVTEIIHDLAAAGLPLPKNIYTIDQAKEALLAIKEQLNK